MISEGIAPRIHKIITKIVFNKIRKVSQEYLEN